MMDDALHDAAKRLIALCRDRKLMIVTAESCTGGLIAATLTDIAGSSDVLYGGFVTYSNLAKERMIEVPANTLKAYGAVSRETAEAMAAGALARAETDLSVAVTGIAGPGGGTETKPVGLVHLAAASRGGQMLHREKRFGNLGRTTIRELTVAEAFTMLEHLATAR